VLILDEPTNDLDIETLELLKAYLTSFDGTLLIVSHDRQFLNNVVTSTLVFEGDGRIEEYLGGYDDWQRERSRSALPASPAPDPPKRTAPVAVATARKLSYRERLELEALPARIEVLETEHATLTRTIADPGFYKEASATITSTLARVETLKAELDETYRRWDALDSKGR